MYQFQRIGFKYSPKPLELDFTNAPIYSFTLWSKHHVSICYFIWSRNEARKSPNKGKQETFWRKFVSKFGERLCLIIVCCKFTPGWSCFYHISSQYVVKTVLWLFIQHDLTQWTQSLIWELPIFFIFSLLHAFLLLGLQLHFLVDWLPMIGARQPSGPDYLSLLTVAYPTGEITKHDESWACKSNWEKWIRTLVVLKAQAKLVQSSR